MRALPFDPKLYAREQRQHPLSPMDAETLARFGPHGAWRAGTSQLTKVVLYWWSCEASLAHPALAQAQRLLETPEAQGLPWGDPAALYEAEHRLARALVPSMIGEPSSSERWREAALAHVRALEQTRSRDTKDELGTGLRLCHAMLELAHPNVAPSGDDAIPPPRSAFAKGIAAALKPRSKRPAEQGAPLDDLHAFGAAIFHRRDPLLGQQPSLPQMALLALACARLQRASPGVASLHDPLKLPSSVSALIYALHPGLPLAPSLSERGWQERTEVDVAIGDLTLETLDAILRALALKPLSKAQSAIWTREERGRPPGIASPDPGLEATLREGTLALRGSGAGRVAGALAALV